MIPRLPGGSKAISATSKLAELVGEKLWNVTKTRVDVVSSDLCGKLLRIAGIWVGSLSAHEFELNNVVDDVLRRLEPSLPKDGSYDIVDINPGVCLWSSKVHDALKPRQHILLEPDRELYSPYIDLLLNQKGSKFRHASTISEVLEPANGLFNKNRTTETDNKHRKGHLEPFSINSSLIVLANLTAPFVAGRRQERQISKQNLYKYYATMFDRKAWLHRYGLVRMIAWMPDKDAGGLMPRSVVCRNRQSLRFDLFTDRDEVASGDYYQAGKLQNRRLYDLDIESQHVVAQKVALDQPWNPPSRHPKPVNIPMAAFDVRIEADLAQMVKHPDRQPWVEELLAFRNTRKHARLQSKRSKLANTPQNYAGVDKAQYKKLLLLKGRLGTEHKRYKACLALATQQRRLDKQENSLTDSDAQAQGSDERLQALREEMNIVQKEIEGMIRDCQDFVYKCIDDTRAFDHVPPVLVWDQRWAEPLMVSDKEFRPTKPLALLDIKPQLDFISRIDTLDKQLCFEFVCVTLLSSSKSSLYDALKQMLQGGVEDFIKQVPSLNKASQANSGIFDYRVRCLPASLFLEIALAWEAWPFRPPTEAMIMSLRDDDGRKFK